MGSKTLSDLLFSAIIIAEKAGDKIMEVYSQNFDIDYKDDKSPLTSADRLSHEVIYDGLASLHNRFPILSEEGKDIPYGERKSWKYFWLVDPLDGTKEFIKRNGEFTVNIALIYKQKPILGVIYAPDKDVLYYAAEGIGAYKLGNSSKYNRKKDTIENSIKLPIAENGNRPFTIVGSRSHHSDEIDIFTEEMKLKFGEVAFISAGSSLKFCLVADGTADAYPRFGPTMEWDTAAGQAIIEQAGGEVIETGTGKPLAYKKENLLNLFFVARSPFNRQDIYHSMSTGEKA